MATHSAASQVEHPRRTRSVIACAVAVVALAAALTGAGATGALAGGGGGGGGHHNHGGGGGGNGGGGGGGDQPRPTPETPDIPPGEPPFNPLQPIIEKSEHYIPKPPGTSRSCGFWYGP